MGDIASKMELWRAVSVTMVTEARLVKSVRKYHIMLTMLSTLYYKISVTKP